MTARLNPIFQAALNDGPAALADLWAAGHTLSTEERAAFVTNIKIRPPLSSVLTKARAMIQFKEQRKAGMSREDSLEKIRRDFGQDWDEGDEEPFITAIDQKDISALMLASEMRPDLFKRPMQTKTSDN